MTKATQSIGAIKHRPLPVRKRTSQGTYNKPKNKHARKNWKKYVGQG